MYNKLIRKILLVLFLAVIFLQGIYSAGTNEVEARELQFTDPYKHLDLPYSAGLSLKAAPLNLSFDFTIQKQVHYQYNETIHSIEMDSAGMLNKTISQVTDAEMVVKQTGMGFADIIYNNMISTITKSITDTAEGAVLNSDTVSDPLTVTHAGYNHKGIYPYNTTLDFTYNLQFPITNTDIQSGKSVSIPISMPVIALKNEIAAEGDMLLTHAGYVEIKGQRYAKLLSEITIDNSSLAGDFGSEFSLNLSGYGVYYFNVAEKTFYYGALQFETTIETAALMPIFTKFNVPGQKADKRILSSRVSVRYEQLN
ncbi:MAG: hypothetical protein H8D65_02495 [Spirochaetes bacterium]|nr:hypothetical protein [Spirochaetota bacterium]